MSTSRHSAPQSPASTTASSEQQQGTPKLASSSSNSKTKPANLFSNDGSFLERFQRIKKEEDDKKAAEEAVAKKRNFEDRFKKRGKRPAPSVESPDSGASTAESGGPVKKPKTEKVLTQYEKEVQGYQSRSLKDQGMGVRPLVK